LDGASRRDARAYGGCELKGEKSMKKEYWLSALAIFIAVLGYLLHLYTLKLLWLWFVVPVFNVPELSMLAIAGLWLTHGFAAGKHKRKPTDPNKKLVWDEKQIQGLAEFAGIALLAPPMILATAFVIKSFI
jgi:hypothetical protein